MSITLVVDNAPRESTKPLPIADKVLTDIYAMSNGIASKQEREAVQSAIRYAFKLEVERAGGKESYFK